jgi:hypothetical protein
MSERKFEEIQGQRGEVVILENEGDFVQGILTGKVGRTIGEGNNSIETVEVLELENNSLKLIPAHTVLRNLLKTMHEKFGDEPRIVKIAYKGKKEGKENSYHNFALMQMEATQEEILQLAEFEKGQEPVKTTKAKK